MSVLGVFVIFAVLQVQAIEMRIGIPPASIPHATSILPLWRTVQQKLDHFNDTDSRVWDMRYLENDQFYKSGGPIFIMLGGEEEIDVGWLMSGMMYDMARKHHGIMFGTEHRFFGESFPLQDLTSESLIYLASYQAIEDIAHFIRSVKSEETDLVNSKVVVVGASYSGSLATWARLKHPELIDAAYASSAPLIAIEDFYSYFEVVALNILKRDEKCYDIIRKATEEVGIYMETQDGRAVLSELFNTCEALTNDEPARSHFFDVLAGIWGAMVQYSTPKEIRYKCRTLTEASGKISLEKLAYYVKERLGYTCLGDYNSFIDFVSNTNLSNYQYRGWIYLTCTEFGFFQTSNSKKHPFGRNNFLVDYHRSLCKDAFGIEYTPDRLHKGIDFSNRNYGIGNNRTSHVVSVYGDIDPWHSIGLSKSRNPEMPVFLVKNYSHAKDIYSISDEDTKQMRNVKKRVKKYIAAWIK